MLRNFIAEIIHATTKIVSPKGEFEGLKTDELNVRTLRVSDTAEVKNKLTVVEETKTKTLTVDNDATIKHDITVENNVTVKKKLTVETQADVADLLVTAVNKDSKAWGGDDDAMPLMTSASYESNGKPGQTNITSNGTTAKLSRANHTHKIPESIKNPYSLVIKENSGREHSYNGGEGENTVLHITSDFVGAAPKAHASLSGATYGQATDNMFGHVKLYTAGSLVDGSGNLDESENGPMQALDSKGLASGFALTPASLASYARYVKESFLPVPINPTEAVTITRELVVNGDIVTKGRIRVKDSVYLDGTASSNGTSSDSTLKIYGCVNDEIAKIQFGADDKDTILRSSKDGHLYIEHDNQPYTSKLTDYEIEMIITSNANKQYRKWVPSKEGMYRIYMIGGGGYSARGIVVNRKNASSSSEFNAPTDCGPYKGYGLGQAYPGFGGGGGPVVTIDLITKNADAINDGGEDITINDATYRLNSDSESCEFNASGTITLTSVTDSDGVEQYSGSVTCDSVVSGSRFCSSGNFTDAKIASASFSLNFSNVSGVLDVTETTVDGVTQYTINGGSITIFNTNITFNNCTLEGEDVNSANIYTLNNVPIKNITISHITTSGDDNDDGVEYEGDDHEIGARFIFLNARSFKTDSDGTPNYNRGVHPRAIAVQGLGTVGSVVNACDVNGTINMTELKKMGVTGFVATDVDSAAKTENFDAVVGHGIDMWVATSNSFGGATEYISNIRCRSYLPKPDINPRCFAIEGPMTGYMYGGSSHLSGSNGWSCQGDLLPGVQNSQSDTYRRREESRYRLYGSGKYYYACQDGYCGGCPGSIGVTGIIGGKGSIGGKKTQLGYKYSTKDKLPIMVQGGQGSSIAIASLDGYSCSIKDSDTSTPGSVIMYPGFKSSVGGIGYTGGGNGGGGAAVRNTSYTSVVSSYDGLWQSANNTYKQNGPCVIIVYLGKQKK